MLICAPMKNTVAALMLILVPLLACKNLMRDSPAGNCNASAVPDKEFCFEYPKSGVEGGKNLCASSFKGVWSEGTCNRTNALGVCKLSNGNNKVFYAGTQWKTADDAKKECSDEWVGPNEK